MNTFEPKIVGFCCNWCVYRAADLAGTSRIHYPANIRIIRVMCSGAVDPIYIFEAFKGGQMGSLLEGDSLEPVITRLVITRLEGG